MYSFVCYVFNAFSYPNTLANVFQLRAEWSGMAVYYISLGVGANIGRLFSW